MGKYGKWIGGGLGWAFGGPIGGILGFVFGAMYDKMQGNKYEERQTGRGDFSASLLILTAAVIKADNKILKSELDFVKRFFVQQFGAEAAKEQILLLKEILKQEIPLQEVALQIKTYMDYQSRLQLMHYLWGISGADGNFHPNEINTIEIIGTNLGISQSDFNSIKAMFVKDVDSAYKILEITPNATVEEIKKAYRKMALKYHPDRVSHLGEEFQKAAKEKFQKVGAAYEAIKKKRGFN